MNYRLTLTEQLRQAKGRVEELEKLEKGFTRMRKDLDAAYKRMGHDETCPRYGYGIDTEEDEAADECDCGTDPVKRMLEEKYDLPIE